MMKKYLLIVVAAALLIGGGYLWLDRNGEISDPLHIAGMEIWLPEYPHIKMKVKYSYHFGCCYAWDAVSGENEKVERKAGFSSSPFVSSIQLNLEANKKTKLDEHGAVKYYAIPILAHWPQSFSGQYHYIGLFSQEGEKRMHYHHAVYVGNYVTLTSLESLNGSVVVNYKDSLGSREDVNLEARFDEAHQPLLQGTKAQLTLYRDGQVLVKR